MSEFIKYVNTDILAGLKYIKVGLNNIPCNQQCRGFLCNSLSMFRVEVTKVESGYRFRLL